MNFAVIRFPGSNCDQDCVHVLKNVLGQPTRYLWHKDTSVGDADAIIVPGGFSYGDYLRTGSIAQFSPVMQAVKEFANKGGLVLGICNGFQILCESGLLPGALVRNKGLKFLCEHVHLKVARTDSPFTSASAGARTLRIPIAHGEGCYFADAETLASMKAKGQILWQYAAGDGSISETDNPNGSVENIAGVCNEAGNVGGLMPHPERASEGVLNSEDGRLIFESMINWFEKQKKAAA